MNQNKGSLTLEPALGPSPSYKTPMSPMYKYEEEWRTLEVTTSYQVASGGECPLSHAWVPRAASAGTCGQVFLLSDSVPLGTKSCAALRREWPQARDLSSPQRSFIGGGTQPQKQTLPTL